jgi:hypothetical protein
MEEADAKLIVVEADAIQLVEEANATQLVEEAKGKLDPVAPPPPPLRLQVLHCHLLLVLHRAAPSIMEELKEYGGARN